MDVVSLANVIPRFFTLNTSPLTQQGCLILSRSVTGLEHDLPNLHPGVPIYSGVTWHLWHNEALRLMTKASREAHTVLQSNQCVELSQGRSLFLILQFYIRNHHPFKYGNGNEICKYIT